jgi:hypothetical protein
MYSKTYRTVTPVDHLDGREVLSRIKEAERKDQRPFGLAYSKCWGICPMNGSQIEDGS